MSRAADSSPVIRGGAPFAPNEPDGWVNRIEAHRNTPPHRIESHRIASNCIALHRTASHRIALK